MPAHVYSEYDVSMPVSFCSLFSICSVVMMRYMFPLALLSKMNGKRLDFLFSSPGLQLDCRLLHAEREEALSGGKMSALGGKFSYSAKKIGEFLNKSDLK